MDKQEIKNLISSMFDNFYDLEEEIDNEQPNHDKVDLLCREIHANVKNVSEMNLELKRKGVAS